MSRSIRIAPPPASDAGTRPLALERAVSAFAVLALLAGMSLPATVLAEVRDWSLWRTPATIAGGAPAEIQLTVTNTGDGGGGDAVGCVIIAIPASAFTVTNAVVDSVSHGGAWTSSTSTDGTTWFVRLAAASSGGDRLPGSPAESLVATITVQDTGVDGAFTWTGNAYNKADCTDDFFMPRSLTVTIDGVAANTAPTASDDSYSVAKSNSLTVGSPGLLTNDDDADGDMLSAALVGGPTNGGLAWGGDGSFTYTPDPGFVGTDTFTYRADDGAAQSVDATVTVTVLNAAPVAVDDLYATAWLQPLVEPAPGILGNDADADGDPLSASIVSGPSNGTLAPNADGSFTYLPGLLFTGTDSFVYQVTDGTDVASATVTIVVSNTAPVAADDGPYAATEDATLSVGAPGVLANDTDPDGHPMSAQLATDAANGAVSLAADGSFDYVPDADFNGSDSFTYRASDGLDPSGVTSVFIVVAPVNDPPIASADGYSGIEDTTLLIPAPGVLGNDADADGDPFVASVATAPASGVAAVAPDGSLHYVPNPDTNGLDSFTYNLSDGTSSATGTVMITVAAVNDAPVATFDVATTSAGTSVVVDAIANDTDVDGDGLTLASVGTPSSGTAAIRGGQVRYTPATGFAGAATVSYTVSDGAASVDGTITITVTPPAPIPSPVPTSTPPSTPKPAPTSGPTPGPTARPVAPPAPTPSAPVPTTTESTALAAPTPSAEPTPAASGGPGYTDGSTDDPVTALDTPELTTAFDITNQAFAFENLLGSLGGQFGWAVPAAVLGVPGLLFMLAVAGQVFGAAAWLPAIRRVLAGIGVQRRDRSHSTPSRRSPT